MFRKVTQLLLARTVRYSDVIWHFSEPVFTNLAFFEMVWHRKFLNLFTVWLQILIKFTYLLFGSKKFGI